MMAARVLAAFGVPLGALVAAYLAVPRLADVPASLAGVKVYAPHVAIALGLAVSVGFGRGRTFFSLVVLALAYAGVRAVPGTTLYHAITVALPLNLAVLAWRRETGVLTRQGVRYGAGIAAGTVLIVAFCVMFPVPLDAVLQQSATTWLPHTPLGQPAVIATALGTLTACAAWLYRREAAALALAAAIVAFALGAHAVTHSDTASLFIATAAAVLVIAVLQDMFRMAFRDPLTGLMSRRALDEDLAALGRRYVIAMVDVDHFKRVNDTYGHDTGDHILKMVARQLARARGVRAYRYGGEEFALLFPGQDASGAWEQLEALRRDIAEYPFRVRAPGRKRTRSRGPNRKAGSARALKVTVSIGVAQAEAGNAKAHAVLAMADKALYRAKHNGRNTVCRIDRKR